MFFPQHAGKRIAVLLPDLRGGGAERMHVDLTRVWLARGCEVEFVLLRAKGELLRFLPKGTRVTGLEVHRVRSLLWPLVRYLRQARPDVLLAAMWPLTVIAPLAAKLAGFRGRVVVSEHNNMTAAYKKRGRLHRAVMGASMRMGYPLADAVVGVSEGVVRDLSRLSGRPPSRFKVIYNPACVGVSGSTRGRPALLIDSGPIVLSVGTLKSQKRHDVLLEAFARLPESLGAQLCILGEGELRSELEQRARELAVEHKVVFAGFQADTAPWYASADLFVLSSDYEGFGNVIVEALEHGVPVVSTDCPSGPREILEDGKYGRLVPVGDPQALAAAMLNSLQASHDHGALRARAQDFAVDKVADEYQDLLLPGWREAPTQVEARP